MAVHVRYKQKRGKRDPKRTSYICGVRQKRQSVFIIIIIIIFLRLMSNLQHPRTLINWLHLCHKQQPPIRFWLCMENKAPINFYAFPLKYFGTVMTTHHPIKHYDRLKLLVSDTPLTFLCMNHFYRRISSFKSLYICDLCLPFYNILFVCLLKFWFLSESFKNKDCPAG